MTILIRRFATSGILVIWGIVMTYFYFSDRVSAYLHPNFHIPVLVCGFALSIMAVAMMLVSADAECGDPQCCGAITTSPIRWSNAFAWILLVIPLLVAVKYSPSEFGASAVLNRGLVVDASSLPSAAFALAGPIEPPLPGEEAMAPAGSSILDSSTYLVKNAQGQIKVESIDLLFAAQEESLRADFEDKEIEIIGQFLPAKTNNPKGDRFNLIRVYITCCAADGRPISVNVQTTKPPKFSDMIWLRVTGKATFPVEGGNRMPLIIADSVEVCDAPPETATF